MKDPYQHSKNILTFLLLSSLILVQNCKKENTGPEPVGNPLAGQYKGKMVSTTEQIGKPILIQLTYDPITVEIQPGRSPDEVKWKLITVAGEYDDPWTTTVSSNGTDSHQLTLPKQKTGSSTDPVEYEGQGTVQGNQFTFTLIETDKIGRYEHQITATR